MTTGAALGGSGVRRLRTEGRDADGLRRAAAGAPAAGTGARTAAAARGLTRVRLTAALRLPTRTELYGRPAPPPETVAPRTRTDRTDPRTAARPVRGGDRRPVTF
ncbi:hypothetical protein GCM10010346_25080 [Streptomyces chryseus]|uniref:Uncharacterized protein n=1 Tax=Streptomyces chryseus TaxID=68186 RepID=A0ABQ3DJC4_9ACTN|nr:hypothetical protein GCM10010346_25080 [Streptomyces chryseus]